MDEFLQKYLDRFEQWSRDGTISSSSRVIPVGSFRDARQWILPSEQALAIVKEARMVALQKCVCRQHYSRCDNPLEVCLVFNEVADTLVRKGIARIITLEQAADVLIQADKHGLVHLSLYMPDHQVFALCSCCSCCCHDLRLVLEHQQQGMIAHAEYIAVTDTESCTDCLLCIERCVFQARTVRSGKMVYDSAACLGCGLCVSVCTPGATTLIRRTEEDCGSR